MKVTVITVPGDLRIPPQSYPFDVLHVLAVLQEEGHVCRLIDNYAWRTAIDVVGEEVKRFGPDVVLLWGPLEALKNMRAYAKASVCPVIIIGDWWRHVPWKALSFARIVGAPEAAIAALLKRGSPKKLRQVTGRVRSPNSQPHPPVSWFSPDPYNFPLPYGPNVEGWKVRLDVEASRLGQLFSAKYLIDFVQHLRIRYGMDGVRFYGNLVDESKRALDFLDGLKTTDLGVSVGWMCDINAHNIDFGRLQRMKDNSCCAVRLEVPTVEHFVNDYERKALEAAVHVAQVLDVSVYMEFKIGYPTDTLQAYVAAVEFCRVTELECRPILATPLDLLKNVKLSSQRLKQLWKRIDRTPALNMSPWSMPKFLGLRELMAKEDLESLSVRSPL